MQSGSIRDDDRRSFKTTLGIGATETDSVKVPNDMTVAQITVSGLSTSEVVVKDRPDPDAPATEIKNDAGDRAFTQDDRYNLEVVAGYEISFEITGGSDTGVEIFVLFKER